MKGRLVGRGGTAAVYEWGPGRVVKLFTPEYAHSATRELAATRAVHAAGVCAPEVFERVSVDGREGIVFERVDGPTLLESSGGDYRAMADRLAEVHAGIHACRSPDLVPRAEKRRDDAAQVAPEHREAFDAREALLPQGDAICHALFHPGHVIESGRGPAVIDWPDAFSGPPAIDVARTAVFLRFLGARAGEDARRKALADRYLDAYLERSGEHRDAIECCVPLVAFTVLRYAPQHPERAELERLAALP